jgi:type II secretory pathway pseudopilin PulG
MILPRTPDEITGAITDWLGHLRWPASWAARPPRARVKLHPAPMSNPAPSPKGTKARAFTLTEFLITFGCILLLATIFLAALAKSKARSSRLGCVNYMKQIGLAFRTWSLDNNDHFPMQVSVANGGTLELVTNGLVSPHFQVMSNELSFSKVLVCPEDKKRSYPTNFGADLTDTKVSYFLNMDATNDGSSLLIGDRNITNRAPAASRLVPLTRADTIAWTREIHYQKGYLGFGDGRVESFNNGSVGASVKIANGTTNRLAVP